MSGARAKLLLAACSLLAIALVAFVDLRKTSPGPLASVHERENDLVGRAGCAACHGGWFSSMTDSCLECHDAIERQLDAHQGLHGVLEPALASSCGTCHGEHHGAASAIVNRQSFARAGVADPARFDHALVGFLMDGAHAELACTECHEHADDAVLARGERRYGGLDQSCVTCHEDPHDGQMALACASCHGQATWDGLHSVDHERFLPLEGGHGDVACRTCHAELSSHSLEALGARGQRPADRACTDCHANPHTPRYTERAARLVDAPIEQSCVECHAVPHTAFADARATLTSGQHALSGFALTAAHARASCEQCHDVELATYAARFPGRASETCSACHADPHGGQFSSGPFAAGECRACHGDESFVPHTFTLEQHARTSFALTGAHTDTACDVCHDKRAPDAPREFRGTRGECAACHVDAHDGFFGALPAAASEIDDCSTCHGTQRFADLPLGGFEHARFTGFDVRGAHAQSACEACHPLAPVADASGRRFGRVSEQHGAFEGCATCHADPHAGRFDSPRLPATVAGRSDCARCHDEVSFREFPHGFDHALWTGFALTDAHAAVSCGGCHAQLHRPDALGRTWGPANGTRCSDCHGDPHARQFDVNGATDCARCHESDAADFVSFDHEHDARFALGEAHAQLECAACHATLEQDGAAFVQYRPLPIECVDCHGAAEEVLLRRSSGRR